jgi:hypothetical protein
MVALKAVLLEEHRHQAVMLAEHHHQVGLLERHHQEAMLELRREAVYRH